MLCGPTHASITHHEARYSVSTCTMVTTTEDVKFNAIRIEYSISHLNCDKCDRFDTRGWLLAPDSTPTKRYTKPILANSFRQSSCVFIDSFTSLPLELNAVFRVSAAEYHGLRLRPQPLRPRPYAYHCVSVSPNYYNTM